MTLEQAIAKALDFGARTVAFHRVAEPDGRVIVIFDLRVNGRLYEQSTAFDPTQAGAAEAAFKTLVGTAADGIAQVLTEESA